VTLYFERDDILIYHADCRDVDIPAVDVVVISDPPYGIGFVKGASGGRGNWRAGHDHKASRHAEMILADDEPFDPSPWLKYGNVLLWGANHFCRRLPDGGRWLAWNKLEHVESFDSFSDVEFAWHSMGKACRIFNYLWKGGVATRKGPSDNNGRRDHQNQKPVPLMAWCIQQANVLPSQTILDPYMGVGTTLVAAQLGNFKAIGIEIEERYCEIAARRLEQPMFKFSEQVDGGLGQPETPP